MRSPTLIQDPAERQAFLRGRRASFTWFAVAAVALAIASRFA
jgi:hypothetical protein